MSHSQQIKDIFASHQDYYCSVNNETIKQQAGHNRQVGADYQGRVLYELIQNAVDRAEQYIKVVLNNNRLWVGNDGKQFTYQPEYDYKDGGMSRSDFQSLCSISTSAKDAETSIGNKGVGFKSTFSVSKNGYVNIHTLGDIIGHENSVPVSFRLYDQFNGDEDLSTLNYPSKVKDFINKHSNVIKQENQSWGIPGYYFPLLLEPDNPDTISTWFKEGYVTVIEILVNDSGEIERLIDELKSKHFRFLSVKYPNKNFEIVFEQNKMPPVTMKADGEGRMYTAPVSEEVLEYGRIAGLQLEMSSVSVYFRSPDEIKGSCGHLYNYLATNMHSPIVGVDFNADFYTTVDRKSINLSGKVGNYNKALLKACYQLYFSLVFPVISYDHLHIKPNSPTPLKPDEFQWEWVKYNESSTNELLNILREILPVNKVPYLAQLYVQLASWYFSVSKADKNNASAYFETIRQVAYKIIHIYNCSYYPCYQFLEQVGKELKERAVRVLPDTVVSGEILYRQDDNSNVVLPDILGVQITSFNVGDDYISKGLGIKKFNEYNEVYKYFKQCRNDGTAQSEEITEEQQIKLLSTLCELISHAKEREHSSTDRMIHFYSQNDRDNNTVSNQAAFALSTLFFKTKEGKYKPGQLLRMKEIDPEFLEKIKGGNPEKEILLLMAGVSPYENYFYADCRIYKEIGDGLNHIPSLIDIKSVRDNLSSKDILENIKVYQQQKDSFIEIHPAIINPHYDFLKSISDDQMRSKEVSNLLVRKYEKFPVEYLKVLKTHIEENFDRKAEIIRFYQKYAVHFYQNGHYLVMLENELKWTDKIEFSIVENTQLFNIWAEKISGKPILCYSATSDTLPENLRGSLVKSTIGECSFRVNSPDDESLKKNILERMIYFIYLVSEHSKSEMNYLEDANGLIELREKVKALCIKRGDGLTRKITLNQQEIDESINYAINRNDLYLDNHCSLSEQAKAISMYLFRNTSITDSFELTLFHKNVMELEKSINEANLRMLRKHWKEDYEEKEEAFLNDLDKAFPELGLKLEKDWFQFNQCHQSQVLLFADEKGVLNELKTYIAQLVQNAPYSEYFPDFSLKIDERYIQADSDKLLNTLNQYYSEQEVQLIQELNQRRNRLSNPVFVKEQIQLLKQKYPNFDNEYNLVEIPDKDYEKEAEEETIYGQLTNMGIIPCESLNLFADGHTKSELPNYSKNIFHGGNEDKNYQDQCVTTGVQGEKLVLIELVRRFVKECTDSKSQKEAIRQIDELVRQFINTPIPSEVIDACYDTVGTPELQRALIPLFYYTRKEKYAHFDLVGFMDGKAIIVEVKSTSDSSKIFHISRNEVGLACQLGDNYELIRVVDGKLLFLGNPFLQLKDKLADMSNERFSIYIKEYRFELK